MMVASSVHLPAICSAGAFLGTLPVPWHDHPADELIIQAGGDSTVATDEGELRLRGCGAFCIPAGTRHDQLFHARTPGLYVVYRWRERSFSRLPRTLTLDQDDALIGWMRDLVALHSTAPEPVAAALLLAVLQRLASQHAQAFAGAAPPPSVQRACRHLDSHLAAPVSATALATVACVSASHLRALFQRHLGLAPQEYHLRNRIALAGRLLRSSSLPVSAIAAQCGFADAGYFTRCFRRILGRPPRRWRR